MNRLQELYALGQAIWIDFIRRAFLDSGEMQALVDQGVVGMTSNPSIFEKAIAGSTDYDKAILALAQAGKGTVEIYEALALEDIARAADLLRPVYDRTNGLDGYVSLEVSPELAHDTAGTVADARRFFQALGRPNVMIKVPATPEGIPAIETLIGDGINVNVTLIFSNQVYRQVVNAFMTGLEKLVAQGGDPARVASVASYFVSRVDSSVDKLLAPHGTTGLEGKLAIANAKLAFQIAQELYGGKRWARLAAHGARPQRLLWASTSTKNPAYPDTYYVDELIGPGTVNTVPPETLVAFMDHGKVAVTLSEGVETAQAQVAELSRYNIDLDQVTEDLLQAGVEAFAKSFRGLLASIEQKRQALLAVPPASANLQSYAPVIDQALLELQQAGVIQRIWQHDHTVWSQEPAEITNRLGWLHTPSTMEAHLAGIEQFAAEVRQAGYTHAVLLGMGGSSLAPEVFRKVFGGTPGYLDLEVLDSTDADAVGALAARLDFSKTLFIVSTKSGGTVETFSFFKFFYNAVSEVLGATEVGAHFAAITDPGSKLEEVARQHHFRAVFLNDPNIGGRYSALSMFGLVPAALVGVDVRKLLHRAQAMSRAAGIQVARENQAAWLGVILGELARAGRDKLTLLMTASLESFGDWVEQLVAESTGKAGRGILPVVGEPLGDPTAYGLDRLFVGITLQGDARLAEVSTALDQFERAGHPVVRLSLADAYDLGGQFFLWEMATAVAGARLGIQPFDQPDVESAKVMARKMVAAYQQTGTLPAGEASPLAGNALAEFIAGVQPGEYIAIQAYLPPTPETTQLLQQLRTRLRDHTRLAVTFGYGPRFLHSTGQLHKGDAGNGRFILLTSDPVKDLPIPDEAGKVTSGITFGVLKLSQALGDMQALQAAQPPRRVIRFHLGNDPQGGLQSLAAQLA